MTLNRLMFSGYPLRKNSLGIINSIQTISLHQSTKMGFTTRGFNLHTKAKLDINTQKHLNDIFTK